MQFPIAPHLLSSDGSNVPLAGSTLMIDSRAKTLEQQPPKMRASMTPTLSHAGIVSIKTRPARAMTLLKTGRLSSMPYMAAFSREGAALITRGSAGFACDVLLSDLLPPLLATFCCCCLSRACRRRAPVMAGIRTKGGASKRSAAFPISVSTQRRKGVGRRRTQFARHERDSVGRSRCSDSLCGWRLVWACTLRAAPVSLQGAAV